jgi:hypothetical protein
MANPIKRFFRDFWHLPKHKFGQKYLLLPFAIVFLCSAMWLTSRVLTPLNNLERVAGTVASMDSVVTRVKDKPLYKRLDKELRIYLSSRPNYYMVSTSSDFGFITSKVRVGDEVVIFTNPPFETFIFGKSDRICQLEHNGEKIIEFKEQNEKYYPSIALLLTATIGFFIWYFYTRRKAAANNSFAKVGMTK